MEEEDRSLGTEGQKSERPLTAQLEQKLAWDTTGEKRDSVITLVASPGKIQVC